MILIRTTVSLLRRFISSKLFKFYMSYEINSVRMDKIRRDYLFKLWKGSIQKTPFVCIISLHCKSYK